MRRIRVIDYLKTVAIIGVVLYHCGIIKNGYLGVEVFFVVSGYLMIKKISKSIDEDIFHPVSYLAGRVASFWPLIAVSGLLALLVGFLGMLPDDYENLAQSVIASNLFVNNVLQAITTKNYWDIVNCYKPLMHTWYIGVLLQTVVFLCFVLWGGKKILNISVKSSLCVITVISFIGFCLPFFSDADKFYWFPFRLFEITLGCLIPYIGLNLQSKKTNIIICISSFWLILFVMFSGYDTIVFWGKIIVLISTCLVILTCDKAGEDYVVSEKIFSVISLPGKYSYDVYIWHQIVIAFMFYSFFSETEPIMIGLVILVTFVLSVCSVQIRKKCSGLSKTSVRLALASVLALAGGAVSFAIYLNAGVVRDVPELGISTKDVHRNMHAEYCDIPYAWNKDFEDSNKVHVLVLGNSFARDFANILNESELSQQIEISYLYGADTSAEKDRVAEADYIFYGTDSWNIPRDFPSIPNNKLYIVGKKSFGKSNGIIYKNRKKDWYFDQRVQIPDDKILINNAIRGIYGEHYIDMMNPLLDESNNIKVFTDDNHFISQDCRHLTKYGAQYYARILDLDFIINND